MAECVFDPSSPVEVMKHRMSLVDEKLTDCEMQFLKLVADGNIESLKPLLKQNKQLYFDCCDSRGQRALEITVKTRNIELIEFLLDEFNVSAVHYYGAILRAVLEKDVFITQMLLDRASNLKDLEKHLRCMIGGGPECIRCLPEVAASNLTPLMTAALQGNILITKMFLERDYIIQKPHTPNCTCESCNENRTCKGETLTESMIRINAFRTLASPTYLILTTWDPILAAFQLSHELEKLSHQLPENQREYNDLSEQCANFATDLLDQCRTTEEVKIILCQQQEPCHQSPGSFCRLQLAVQYDQKKFVTHPNCQQVLRSLWVEGLPWFSWKIRKRCLHTLKHSLLAPFICFAYVFAFNSKVIQSLDIPINRFIYFTASYFLFLFLLIFTLLSDRYEVSTKGLVSQICVSLWIFGFFVDLIPKYKMIGFKKSKGVWNKEYGYDMLMALLFLTSQSIFILRMSGVIAGPENRQDMSGFHVVLIGDGIYAIASVMAFSRILIWCNLNSHLGPLIVSFKSMIKDVFRFFILFSVMVLAFSIGINSLYKYYKNSDMCFSKEVSSHQINEFETLMRTLYNLFWAIFGKGEPHFADIHNCRNTTLYNSLQNMMDTKEYKHNFTQAVGYGMWGMYHFAACLVLLNMLIGMMAESYQRVIGNADVEWKFACSTLWLSVFDCYYLVPPPFNLLLTFNWMLSTCNLLKPLNKGSNQLNNWLRCPIKNPCVVKCEEKELKKNKEIYQKLLVQLIRRYLHSKGLMDTPVNSIYQERSLNLGMSFKTYNKENENLNFLKKETNQK